MPKRPGAGQGSARKYVTQKDVAERAGVSPSIVSYVINNGPRSISEETRQRVLRAIAELEYRPNVHAQKLMRASWQTELAPGQFGILVGATRKILKRPYYTNLMFGILEEAAQHNYSLRFLQFFDDLRSPVNFNRLFHPEEVSAIVLLAPGPLLQTEEGLTRLAQIRARVPNVVSIGRLLPDITSLFIELPDAVAQATQHLIDLGHRRIAYLGGPNLRISGYQQALSANNIPFDPALYFDTGTDYLPEDGYRGAQALIESGQLTADDPVTAVMAGNDEIALGAMRRLHEAGLRIPDDLSIIGLDDQEFSALLVPALTTVRIPHQQMGILAIQTIIRRAGHTGEPPQVTVLPTELVIRESTRPR